MSMRARARRRKWSMLVLARFTIVGEFAIDGQVAASPMVGEVFTIAGALRRPVWSMR